MPEGDVETFPMYGSWFNRIEGGETLGRHATREEAVSAGREEAKRRKVEHLVNNLDGRIGERITYGHVPRDIPG